MVASLKPGDKVRLRKMDQEWLVSHEACLVVKQVGDFSTHGIPYGARCAWITSRGAVREKVYALSDLAPA
jgi:hypothetical protein